MAIVDYSFTYLKTTAGLSTDTDSVANSDALDILAHTDSFANDFVANAAS